MGVTHALPGPAMTNPLSYVAIGGGAFGLGNHPLGVPPQHPTIAAGLGATPRVPRPPRRQPRSQMSQSAAQAATTGARAGHYTPGPSGRTGGGRGACNRGRGSRHAAGRHVPKPLPDVGAGAQPAQCSPPTGAVGEPGRCDGGGGCVDSAKPVTATRIIRI